MQFSGLYFRFFVFAMMFISVATTSAQEQPPIPITVEVNTSQFLNFGSFTAGPGVGTVSVNYDSSRSYTGDVVLLNMGESPSAALFDVTANPGTIIQINAPTNIRLTGSNGSEIYLDINSFGTGNPFITSANPPSTNAVYVGGTLNIPANSVNLSGQYTGTFTLTFNHQ